MDPSCCVKQSDSPSTLDTYWEGPDQTNTDNSANDYDTPKYVVGRIRKSRVKDIQTSSREQKSPTRYNVFLLRAQAVIAEAA